MSFLNPAMVQQALDNNVCGYSYNPSRHSEPIYNSTVNDERDARVVDALSTIYGNYLNERGMMSQAAAVKSLEPNTDLTEMQNANASNEKYSAPTRTEQLIERFSLPKFGKKESFDEETKQPMLSTAPSGTFVWTPQMTTVVVIIAFVIMFAFVIYMCVQTANTQKRIEFMLNSVYGKPNSYQ